MDNSEQRVARNSLGYHAYKSKCYLECSGLEYDGKIKRWSKFIHKWLDLKLAAWGVRLWDNYISLNNKQMFKQTQQVVN